MKKLLDNPWFWVAMLLLFMVLFTHYFPMPEHGGQTWGY